MRKVLFCLLVVTAVNLNVFAENGKEENKATISFEILVIDAITEEPLPAVKIKMETITLEVYTGFDGMLEIKEITQGMYDIEISFISYKKQQFNGLKLDKSTNRLIIKLQP